MMGYLGASERSSAPVRRGCPAASFAKGVTVAKHRHHDLSTRCETTESLTPPLTPPSCMYMTLSAGSRCENMTSPRR
jgi:hypothetical protein